VIAQEIVLMEPQLVRKMIIGVTDLRHADLPDSIDAGIV
jgi:hypothetical protein